MREAKLKRFEVTVCGDPCTYNVEAKDKNEACALVLLYLPAGRVINDVTLMQFGK